MVNSGTTYSGKYFKLTSDIILNDNYQNYKNWGDNPPENQWTPIGGHDVSNGKNNTYNFEGFFNGNNHTVYGMYYLNNSLNYVGLFGCVQNATISNVNISQSHIKGNSYVGGIVGYAVTKDIYSTKDYKEKTSISNCHTSIKVTLHDVSVVPSQTSIVSADTESDGIVITLIQITKNKLKNLSFIEKTSIN